MPCENCQAQFTVFRRKRSCTECRRFYCSNCLNSYKRSNGVCVFLCRRCSIFAKRPLLRSDLLQLKPKDLIFYLQSKQISIAGCVEKDELISLVLTHVEHADNLRQNNAERNGRENMGNDSGNSFEGIKQTCQNFFTNLSDNITETFATFDPKKPEQRQHHSAATTPTVEQPARVYFCEMPSYASAQTRMNMEMDSSSNPLHTSNQTMSSRGSSNNYESSPSYSVSSASSSQVANNDIQVERNSTSTLPTDISRKDFEMKSDCECSDDDIMLNFNQRHSIKTDSKQKPNQSTFDPIGPSTSKAGSQSSKLDVYDDNSHSSFEELGAIGGNSDYTNGISPSLISIPTTTTPTTTTANDNENDNDVEHPVSEIDLTSTIDLPTVSTITSQENNLQTTAEIPPVKEKPKVLRRRSDSYLATRTRILNADMSPTSPLRPHYGIENSILPSTRRQSSIQELEEPTENHRPTVSCTRCGKNKANLRRYVDKMRRHLQNSQMSDEDIKREMNEFLEYIENRQRSVDHSDNDTVQSSASGVFANQMVLESPMEEQERTFDENEGIHVYASNNTNTDQNDARFVNIEAFNEIEDLEMLTVRDLKEILMLHRVDYKGCCEKQELLERVQRLWKNLKSTPAVEKLPSDEVCKICMDAPIECVILECGHMATCTSCGKVLNECPICRQYIVRVVRFFRA